MEVQVIDENLLNSVSHQADVSTRLRMNYNFHEKGEDPVNRLLNAMNPGSYFPPHRHLNPDKQEIFLLLRGSLLTFIFDDEGNILDKILISPSKGVYGMEIQPHIWHSFLVLEKGTVVYEVKQGPFTPLSSENIAPWAPASSDMEGVKKFMDKLSKA